MDTELWSARFPQSQTERQAVAEIIGRDGSALLLDIFHTTAPPLLREIPAVEILRHIWIQNYFWVGDQLHWRDSEDIPPAKHFINSPYDQEARYGKKRQTRWTGYKVHLTQMCDEDKPHVITHVATTPAPIADDAMTETIHENLKQADLHPQQHLLDSGYITAHILATSQPQFGIEVIGPSRPDVKWQANTAQGIDASQFLINWEQKQATCPQGHTSSSWTPARDSRQHEVVKIKFATKDCQVCPRLASCTSTRSSTPRRLLTVRPQDQHQALHTARRRQLTQAFAQQYALREGVEATISQSVRAFGMRRSRSIGLPKTHLHHVSIAAAIDIVRVVAWQNGAKLAPTRVSSFERLYALA